MRPSDAKAIKAYRQQQECSLHEAKLWDDRTRVKEALVTAARHESVDELCEIVEFLATKVLGHL